MTTYDLRTQFVTLEELLQAAAQTTVQVISRDGSSFVIEAADEFEQEIKRLRESKVFMSFLKKRSREKLRAISLDDATRELEL
jgi:hypothetical protein